MFPSLKKCLVYLALTSALAVQSVSAAPCAAKKVRDIDTCADFDKAKAEGSVTIYSVDNERGLLLLLEAFRKKFPEIKTEYVRGTVSQLYAKIIAERQAGTYTADLLSMTDVSMARDFQRREGFLHYASPQLPAYAPKFKSDPEGYFAAVGLMIGGFVYNPDYVKPEEAPKSWKELLDPKWKNTVNVRASTNAQQHLVWYMLREKYGDDYFKEFSKQGARPFEACAPQFERLLNGQDKVSAPAVHLCYLDYKRRGSQLRFVVPEEGTPTGYNVYGVVSRPAHPEAAKLFMDWLLSTEGANAFMNALLYINPRADATPPAGSGSLESLKVLVPGDWDQFGRTKTEFNRAWNDVTRRQ